MSNDQNECPICGEFNTNPVKTCGYKACDMEYYGITADELTYEENYWDD